MSTWVMSSPWVVRSKQAVRSLSQASGSRLATPEVPTSHRATNTTARPRDHVHAVVVAFLVVGRPGPRLMVPPPSWSSPDPPRQPRRLRRALRHADEVRHQRLADLAEVGGLQRDGQAVAGALDAQRPDHLPEDLSRLVVALLQVLLQAVDDAQLALEGGVVD